MAEAQFVVRPALPIALSRRVCAIGFFLLTACAVRSEPSTVFVPLESGGVQTVYQGIFDAQELSDRGKTPEIPVLIVPHHLTAAVTIAAGIDALVPQHPTSILLLSPDHFSACTTILCTGEVRYVTPLGETTPDPDVLHRLRSSSLVSEHPALFQREHGVKAVVPFLVRALPSARVTPLVVSIRPQWQSYQQDILDLVRASLKSDTVLVISSDFSHYLPLVESDTADERTAQALFARDFQGIADLHNSDQSDCPACLWVAAKIADERGAYNPSVLLHTNSARLLDDPSIVSTTSHFAIAFYRNAALSGDDLAIGGDVTLTRSGSGSIPRIASALMEAWSGNGPRIVNLEGPLREHCSPMNHPYIFCNPLSLWRLIRDRATHWGIENNHMLDQGIDGIGNTRVLLEHEGEVALDAEGAVVGGMRIFALTNLLNPVVDASAVDIAAQYRRVLHALRMGSGSTLPQVVFVHTGTEYHSLVSGAERAYLRTFIDAGAKAVIAVHSHVQSDMEMYKGLPIFHGIGNFLFDQYDAVSTSTAKIVRLRSGSGQLLFETVLGEIVSGRGGEL